MKKSIGAIIVALGALPLSVPASTLNTPEPTVARPEQMPSVNSHIERMKASIRPEYYRTLIGLANHVQVGPGTSGSETERGTTQPAGPEQPAQPEPSDESR